jgi:hypothetical protein
MRVARMACTEYPLLNPIVPGLRPTYTVHDIRVSMPASVQPLALVSHRPDEWPLAILPMPCQRQGIVEALGGLLVPPSVLMRCGLGWWAPSSCTSVHCTACSSANTMYACLHHHLSWEAGHRPQALGNGAHRWDEQKKAVCETSSTPAPEAGVVTCPPPLLFPFPFLYVGVISLPVTWFIRRMGRRGYRRTENHGCTACTGVYEHGLMVGDQRHTASLFLCQNEDQLEYADRQRVCTSP